MVKVRVRVMVMVMIRVRVRVMLNPKFELGPLIYHKSDGFI